MVIRKHNLITSYSQPWLRTFEGHVPGCAVLRRGMNNDELKSRARNAPYGCDGMPMDMMAPAISDEPTF